MAEIHILPFREGDPVRTINFEYGAKDDPAIIGPDDNVAYEMRTADELKDTPPVLIDAEVKHILPIAKMIAQRIGINALQEAQYGNVLPQIRERSVFVVLNVLAGKRGYKLTQQGTATYFGLIVMCKQHAIVRVLCKCHLATGRWGVSQVHTWHKDVTQPQGGVYHIHGDMEERKLMAEHTVLPLILEYLEDKEKVLKLV